MLRRCQILLASARGEWVPRIAATLGCDDQTVRNVLREFEREGLDACLTRGSSRPHTIHAKVDAVAAEQLRALLHQSPRTFGKPTSVWTMELAAEVSFAEGITAERVSGETIRQAILRLGVRWRRAKQWITSPDPEYARKKVRRDRLIRLAASHPTWVLGFQDEVWWSRLARPSLQTWAEEDDYLRLVEQAVAKDDPDPKALACYGLLLRADPTAEDAADQMWLRFVDGRPVSPVTIDYLDWCCQQAPRGRQGGAAADLGQRPLARQPAGPRLDPRPQPPGQAARRRRPHHRLLLADQEPLAQRHRGHLGPRQAPRRRSRPPAHHRRAGRSRLRRLRLPP